MKKLLYTLIVLGVSAFQVVNAQICNPDLSITTPGIFPDTAIGIDSAEVGIPYCQEIQIRVPPDTVDPTSGLFLNINYIKLDTIKGLPTTFTYACNPGDCSFPGNSNGCMLITGTANAGDTGIHPLMVFLTANVTEPISGATFDVPDSVEEYTLVVMSAGFGIPSCATGIEEIKASKFAVVQTIPNPFTDKTEIIFSLPTASAVEFKVYNLLGKVVYRQNIKAKAGVNTIEFISKGLPSGIYLYSLRNESSRVTRKMIISQY
ncbi:MAG: T9SS type A sorting domain-containing protein [Cytophagales bacterium]|nr:T9SS type A sorting domain-containing protein [Cytophagales bacterium]